ncbi:hypothetical protein KSX_91250 [Ktedonospora formicarum]|uniref:Uncharacterized protein n=1 Tax=Ktedonospora formicarum TaxID=2778364 RepID=A0A8J3IDW1_9CHLR|nr:hypothetical protein KSX_91250 [Ktedonospora formicarum]
MSAKGDWCRRQAERRHDPAQAERRNDGQGDKEKIALLEAAHLYDLGREEEAQAKLDSVHYEEPPSSL